jgi:hypothetical protein
MIRVGLSLLSKEAVVLVLGVKRSKRAKAPSGNQWLKK